MCLTTLFQHKKCKHIWAVISEPCGPGMGFTTCNTFGTDTIKEPPKLYKTQSRPCPRCDLGGRYNAHEVRMVESMGWGFKWGTGPGQEDWGCEMKFGDGCIVL